MSELPCKGKGPVTDYLEEDYIQMSGQNYALISVVSPSSSQKYNTCALKIRGVFATKEDAQHHVKRLMQSDSTFDVFLVDMYKWLPIPPNADAIEDKVYQEDVLNDIIRGHAEEQFRVKQHFDERKLDSMLPATIPEVDSTIPEIDSTIPEVDSTIPEVDSTIPE